MRAHAEGKDERVRRTRIAAATLMVAAGLICAMTAPAFAGVHKYDTKVTIYEDRGFRLVHGDVESEVRKCERGRRVVLFRREAGADRKLGVSRSSSAGDGGFYVWGEKLRPAQIQAGDQVYAKVRKVRRDGDVCRAVRSKTLRNG